MEVLDIPEPPAPGPGEVIVAPDAVGICGSDFHFFAGELQIFEESPYPRVQGHEFTGTIELLGPETSGRLAAGDRVSILPLSHCGECYPCRVGRGNVCDNFSLIGIHTDGGLQEKLRVPEAQVFPISTGEPAIAALAEPFSIGVRTIHRARVADGERVVILGAGPIGQASHLLARDRGASTLLVDRLQSRLDLGASTGAEGRATRTSTIAAGTNGRAGRSSGPSRTCRGSFATSTRTPSSSLRPRPCPPKSCVSLRGTSRTPAST